MLVALPDKDFVAASHTCRLVHLCGRWTLQGPADGALRLSAAYRKAALEHHPDKKGAATADEETKRAIELHFTRVQDAYETLSDPAKRREYDSVDDFDDTLPYECQPADFFKVCALRPPGHGLERSCACARQSLKRGGGGGAQGGGGTHMADSHSTHQSRRSRYLCGPMACL